MVKAVVLMLGNSVSTEVDWDSEKNPGGQWSLDYVEKYMQDTWDEGLIKPQCIILESVGRQRMWGTMSFRCPVTDLCYSSRNNCSKYCWCVYWGTCQASIQRDDTHNSPENEVKGWPHPYCNTDWSSMKPIVVSWALVNCQLWQPIVSRASRKCFTDSYCRGSEGTLLLHRVILSFPPMGCTQNDWS